MRTSRANQIDTSNNAYSTYKICSTKPILEHSIASKISIAVTVISVITIVGLSITLIILSTVYNTDKLIPSNINSGLNVCLNHINLSNTYQLLLIVISAIIGFSLLSMLYTVYLRDAKGNIDNKELFLLKAHKLTVHQSEPMKHLIQDDVSQADCGRNGLSSNVTVITVMDKSHKLALKLSTAKEVVKSCALTKEEIFECVSNMLTTNDEKLKQLSLYKVIAKQLLQKDGVPTQLLTEVTNLYLSLFQNSFINLYNNDFNANYVENCVNEIQIALRLLIDIDMAKKLDTISINLFILLLEFRTLLVNGDVVLLNDTNSRVTPTSHATMKYTSMYDSHNINLVLPNIGITKHVLPHSTAEDKNDWFSHIQTVWQTVGYTKVCLTVQNSNEETILSFSTKHNHRVFEFVISSNDLNDLTTFNFISMLLTHDIFDNSSSYDSLVVHMRHFLEKNAIAINNDEIAVIADLFIFHFKNRFIELISNDTHPLKERELFHVGGNTVGYAVHNIQLGANILRVDDNGLPILIITDNNICFLDFDKIFCGAIVSFMTLLTQHKVCMVRSIDVVNTNKLSVPRSLQSKYIPTVMEIMYCPEMEVIFNTAHCAVQKTVTTGESSILSSKSKILIKLDNSICQYITLNSNNLNAISLFNTLRYILSITSEELQEMKHTCYMQNKRIRLTNLPFLTQMEAWDIDKLILSDMIIFYVKKISEIFKYMCNNDIKNLQQYVENMAINISNTLEWVTSNSIDIHNNIATLNNKILLLIVYFFKLDLQVENITENEVASGHDVTLY